MSESKFYPQLVKIHTDTILTIDIWKKVGLPDTQAEEMFDRFMDEEDFEGAAEEFYSSWKDYTCDAFLGPLRRLIDRDVELRREELKGLGTETNEYLERI